MSDQPAEYDLQQCIQNCRDGHRVCMTTLAQNLNAQMLNANLIRLLLDCAEICQVAANFMLRASERYQVVCAVAARVCEECAQACAQAGRDEQHQFCAEMCQRCADSCSYMAEAVV